MLCVATTGLPSDLDTMTWNKGMVGTDVDESMLGQRLDLELEIKSILYIEERLRWAHVIYIRW